MVTPEQKNKADILLKLHHDKEILVLLNSWDPGSSKLIEACGYKAIATTSMGISASLGYPDCQAIPFNEMADAIRRITSKVNLPVTVDIEGGYGSNIKEIIEYMKVIISTGIVGINIEDSISLHPELLDENEFCERISAIRELSGSLGFHLVINARTDAFLTNSGTHENNLEESIRRGNKYKDAGADCIFVPCVWGKDDILTLVNKIKAPVNILSNSTNGSGLPPSVSELESMGVARLSLGASIMKSTLFLLKKIADETKRTGTYNVISEALKPIPEAVLAYKMATGTTE